MNGLPSIISTIPKISTCDEHRSIILRKAGLWGRFRKGELRVLAETKAKQPPDIDFRGQVRVCYQNIFLLDDSHPKDHPNHIVLQAHCFRTESGSLASSGLLDPKDILVRGKRYVRLSKKKPKCELCEDGDMIPIEERFHGSREYRPETAPMPSWVRLISQAKRWINKRYDLWDQKKAVASTMPLLPSLDIRPVTPDPS